MLEIEGTREPPSSAEVARRIGERLGETVSSSSAKRNFSGDGCDWLELLVPMEEPKRATEEVIMGVP